MRAKKEVFKEFFENMNKKGNDFKKIRDLIKSENGKKYFLGVREDYLSIYYMGMSIAKVKVSKGGDCSYRLSYYYLQGVKDSNEKEKYKDKTKGYYTLSSGEFWRKDNFNKIIENVENHVSGSGNSGHVYLEKVCQQWIINANNNNPESDWYYVDMEYIYKEDGQKSDHPFGRADMIAIKKKPDKKGIFDIAFVELKVGTGAYGISIKVPKEKQEEKARKEYRDKVVKDLNTDLWGEDVIGVKLGSGLASHVVDFMHFFADDKATTQLRKEIFGIIDVHKEFGLINDTMPLYNLESENHIRTTPDIYIVTYSEALGIKKEDLSEKAQKKYGIPLEEMKESFGKYFYDQKGSSSLAIEKLINHDQISGLIELKEKYLSFIDTDEAQIECSQKINEVDFKFVFRFMDLSNEKINPANCIE